MEDQDYRKQSKNTTKLTDNRMREVSYNLTKKVEVRVAKEMKTAGRGAIMYDAWTCASIHYVGLFVCYMRKKGD